MTDPTHVWAECPYSGYTQHHSSNGSLRTGCGGDDGTPNNLCDRCREDRADARVVARMADRALDGATFATDGERDTQRHNAIGYATELLRLAREAGRKP